MEKEAIRKSFGTESVTFLTLIQHKYLIVSPVREDMLY